MLHPMVDELWLRDHPHQWILVDVSSHGGWTLMDSRSISVDVGGSHNDWTVVYRASPAMEESQIPFFLVQMQEGKIMERRKKIALELSELVVYCRPVPFDEDSKSWKRVVMG